MASVDTAIASYQIDLKNAGYVAGAKQVDTANQQMIASTAGVEIVTSKVGNEFERLAARQNPLLAVELRRKNAIEALTRAGEEEAVGSARLNAVLDQTNSKFDQQIARLSQLRGAAANQNIIHTQLTGTTRNMGFAVQNAAFQFGDLAVQIASGQGVIRPLIQQGSQLLQVFGVWGAILGAAGAALGAVVVGMGLFTESAEEKKAATDKATEAAKALTDQEKLLKEALGAVDDQIVKNIGSLSRYAAVGQDQVNAMLATQGTLLRDLIAEQEKEQKNLNVLLGREFQSPSRIKMEQDMAANIADLQRRIDTQKMVVGGLAGQAVRLGKNVPTFGMETTGTTDKPDSSIGREANQRERAVQSIEDQIDALSREEKQIRMTARERAIDVELQRAEMTARNGNIELTAAQILNLTAEAGAKFDSAEASKAIVEAEKEREAAAKDAARESEKAAKELERQLERAADVIGDQANALVSAALGWEDWRDVAKQAINVVINELSKLSSLGGSGGGLFDLLFGLGTAALGGAASAGASSSGLGINPSVIQKAGGGDFPANMNVMVGERGPEIIRSRRAGNVVPNHALGGGNTTVVNNFDFRGAIVDTAKIRSEIGRATPSIVNASEANVSDKRRRGGLPAFRN